MKTPICQGFAAGELVLALTAAKQQISKRAVIKPAFSYQRSAKHEYFMERQNSGVRSQNPEKKILASNMLYIFVFLLASCYWLLTPKKIKLIADC